MVVLALVPLRSILGANPRLKKARSLPFPVLLYLPKPQLLLSTSPCHGLPQHISTLITPPFQLDLQTIPELRIRVILTAEESIFIKFRSLETRPILVSMHLTGMPHHTADILLDLRRIK